MDKIDFRSDTVTWPTPAMREAMATASVGDDVYQEDPTVKELETLAAEMVGMEAGLFVASGTMGNLVAILSHATRGDEAIVGEDAHTFRYEAGGMATLGGIVPRPLTTDRFGQMDLAQVETAVRSDDAHFPTSRLILVENSYGSKQGYPISPDYFAAIRQIGNRHKLSVHMDGARFFNAIVALGIDATEITQHLDSVTFCLSKGLSAPVGSVLCGTTDFIYKAHRARKLVGGGMRQAGVLAAAGLISLDQMVNRLADDHANARLLAEGLAQNQQIRIDLEAVKTNMVFFELAEDVSLDTREFIDELRKRANIWIGAIGSRRFRAVTHYWVSQADVDLFIKTVQDILG